MQLPWARRLHEHRAPVIAFSVDAFSQVQCIAGCFPQVQVASFAQAHPSPERPQQVAGIVAVGADIMKGWTGFNLEEADLAVDLV